MLNEAFAVVREAAKRRLGERHYDVQMVGGMVLHRGGIAEMRTGEGKTLVATLPAYLDAIAGKGVHLITVNDYLASRDAEWMGRIYALPRPVGGGDHQRSFAKASASAPTATTSPGRHQQRVRPSTIFVTTSSMTPARWSSVGTTSPSSTRSTPS